MRRLRFRKSPGTTKALVLAVALHVVVIALLVIGFRWPSLSGGDGQVIKAVVVDQEAARKAEAAEQKQLEEERKRKEAEQQRIAEERKRQENARRQAEEERKRKEAEQRRVAEERLQQQEAARKKVAAEQKRLEDERQRLAAERQRMEQERRRIAEERTRKAEEERKRKEAEEQLAKAVAAEEQAKEEATRARRAASAMDKYIALIKDKVTRNWVRPGDANQELQCEVQVRLAAGGDVLSVTIVRSSGNEFFDRSVENAVRKAAPLPLPEEKDLFEYFREIKFVFHPEGQG